MKDKPRIIFFGTDQDVSVTVLESLVACGHLPELIVTQPDRPQGRKLQLTPCPVKKWADEKNIPTLQPEKLDDDAVATLRSHTPDIFVVASYGLIIPQTVLDIPRLVTLNVHPSLLPLYRGATPLESAMLDDQKETGTTIIAMDNKMDHGPIVAQETYTFDEWPEKPIVARTLATLGGKLLCKSIDRVIDGSVVYADQDHTKATFTKKITKADGELLSTDDDRTKFLKTQAYTPWPGTFFFDDNGKRVKITKASWKNDAFVIERVIPEGKKEMDFTESPHFQ